MNAHPIFVTQKDAEKLRQLIFNVELPVQRNNPYLKGLAAELDRSSVLAPEQIPPDVITMHSQAVLKDLDTGEEMRYTLVYPEEADVSAGKISVLAPIGTAMLGYRAGDSFEWETPGGKRTLRVEQVLYQPEAAGDEG